MAKNAMRELAKRSWRDKRGATAIEYALIAGLIAVVMVPALWLVHDELKDFPAYARIASVLGGN
ncbi:Flp family type IVb pilin [Terrihabitans sp. B22-R8]|uniref:Flp family type IVb pilin n=1 Tax=Terrihabitans sp. B22-R8 TaxID=3425128 RepID=UPI00403C98E2